MSRARMLRIACRVLLTLQAGLVIFCIYHIVDAFSSPYQSEWLTGTFLVPYLAVAILFYAFCMFLTHLVIIGSDHTLAWLWSLPIAAVTLLPYSVLLLDSVRLMGT